MKKSFEILFYFLLSISINASAAGPGDRRLVTILHTNDLHGHVDPWTGWGDLTGMRIGGIDRLATAVSQVREEVGAGQVLLLDGGDTIADTMFASQTKGRVVIDAMNAMRYDAMVVGNHETDFGPKLLAQRIKESRFPVLAANLVKRSNGQHFATPYVIREINGIRIGILGLAYPNTAFTTSQKNVSGLKFHDAIATARKYVPKLTQKGVDLVIVLSHLGLSYDKELAQQVPGIQVIVGGHSHNGMHKAARVGNTLIVQAGAHGSHLGQLDLEVVNRTIVAHQRKLIAIDNDRFTPDAKVAALIAAQRAPFEQAQNEQIGITKETILRAQTLAGQEAHSRDKQSPADILFADLVRRDTGVDVVMLPGIGYGTALSAGAIRAADLRNLIPHDSKVVTLTLTGSEIRNILEQSLENVYTEDFRKKVGGIVQVSGLRVSYERNAPRGERIKHVRVGTKPLSDERRYTVATNSLLASGGHGYRTFLTGKNRRELSEQYDIVHHALKKGTFSAPYERRMTEHSDGSLAK